MIDRARTLFHDLGKAITRTARNLPATPPVPPVLHRMLIADLYALPLGSGHERASERFARLAGDLALDPARMALATLDALEADVRAGDDAALREAARCALTVERVLREHLEALGA